MALSDDLDVMVSASSVKVDYDRDNNLTAYSIATLEDRYLMPDERPQDLFKRVSEHYADNAEHAQRLYDYMSNLWFMPATPVLSNGGTKRGLPISCFLNESKDSLEGIADLWFENIWLASNGGGIGSYWGNVRSVGEKVGVNGKTSGIIPFIRVMDSLTFAISQGSLRRGSAAVYLPIHHPEIEEFIEIRRPTGGDFNRKALNLHHGVVVTDEFMQAVESGSKFKLRSPKDDHVVQEVDARALWIRLLTARIETGEPYILFIDNVNKAIPEHHKKAGLKVKMSNLCSEITLPTGIDHHGKDRTAVCCLSSVNLEKYTEWKDNPLFIEDVMRFLDNVLTDFINNAPDYMKNAAYAATRERSVGLGVMGFHTFLQSQNIPLESVMAKVWNKKIFQQIREQADAASVKLAHEKGPCPDAEEYGVMERFSNKMAIAPTASISTIAGNTSPGIEPIAANSFVHKTLTGSVTVKNRYLKKLLAERGEDTPETWSSITINDGSVQHLDCLTDDEKAVFKTAYEIDQRWLIDLAADRTPFVCQAQSLNLFLPSNVHKKVLHDLHFSAWKKGVKSFYYKRSKSIQRAESQATSYAWDTASSPSNPTDGEECLSCQ